MTEAAESRGKLEVRTAALGDLTATPRPDHLLIATLRAAWDSITTPLLLVDQDTRLLVANPAAQAGLRALGLSVGDRICTPRIELLRRDGVTPVCASERPLARALTGSVEEEEFVLRPADGAWTCRCRLTAYPLTGHDGYPMVLLACRDVTTGADATGADGTSTWLEAVERLSWLVGGAAEYAVFMLDAQGRITTWSSSAQRLFGDTEPEVIGRPFDRFFVPADRAIGVPATLLDLARAAGRAELEGQRVGAQGRMFWARGVLTVVRGERDEVLGFVCVTHDITIQHASQQEVVTLNRRLYQLNADLERRIRERTEELQGKADELAVANGELEAFSYTVSHDLRAPLRAMSGFARLLEEEHSQELEPEALHYLERIAASAQQMGQLIDGLLAFSRLLRQEMEIERLDMNALVEEVWRSVVAGEAPAPRLELGALPPAQGDRRLVLQVWQNLLENSVKFSRGRPQPLVRVVAQVQDGAPSYCVADNGVGFDMRYAHKLFRPFQRLHRSEDFPGNGIGLALVDRIVRRHGGSIRASAEAGNGAQFCFTLIGPSRRPARDLVR